MRQGEPISGGITNDSFGAPLGSGIAILLAAGAGYAVVRRKRSRKNTMLLLACVALLGFTQCKKEEPLEPANNGNTTKISLNVDNGGNKGSRVNVTGADVTFTKGDKILVAYDGKYVGTITHNGTNFTGNITISQNGTQPLYFYFLGNKDAGTLTAGTTTSCSVNISDQTLELPVISMAPSDQNYPSSGNAYTASLHNKASLMKFNVTTPSNYPICITGMNNKVMVDFSKAAINGENNGFTYDKEGEGVIEMKGGGSGEKWAVVLPQDELTEAGTAYSVDGYYTGTRPAMVTITANQYLSLGVSITVDNPIDELSMPLTFEAKNAGATVTFTAKAGATLQYSTNGGASWADYESAITLENVGDKVSFRGDNTTFSTGEYSSYSSYFSCSNDCYIYGNIMSLVYATNFSTATSLPDGEYTFSNLFYNNSKIYNNPSKALVLPATTLAQKCYIRMFYSCTNLTSAPTLPATSMAPYCYYYMFCGTGLTSAPELPATTLAERCYGYMFSGCQSLTSAPVLPATTLADHCYYGMFNYTGLTSAPKLPATTLAPWCYAYMFSSCKSLTTSPELPNTTLADHCYYGMFSSSALTTAPALPADILAEECYERMFASCKSLTSGPELSATTLASRCYESMFEGCTNLTSAPALPAETLATYCYMDMFNGCTKLSTAPTISATTLASNCCEDMFNGCTSLTTVPDLGALTLAERCYYNMFKGCTSLTTAPKIAATTMASRSCWYMFQNCTNLATVPDLSATTLAEGCCWSMFEGCTNLTKAPELPATTLADRCYQNMFTGCSKLETAPILRATNLDQSFCYNQMFKNCTKLNSVTCLATSIDWSANVSDWLSGVAASGTFYKDASSTIFSAGGSYGPPSGWTVTNYVAP